MLSTVSFHFIETLFSSVSDFKRSHGFGILNVFEIFSPKLLGTISSATATLLIPKLKPTSQENRKCIVINQENISILNIMVYINFLNLDPLKLT